MNEHTQKWVKFEKDGGEIGYTLEHALEEPAIKAQNGFEKKL
jgi:hypothetical protein